MSKLERIEKEILHLCGRDLDGDCSYTIHYKTVAELLLNERDNKNQENTQLKTRVARLKSVIGYYVADLHNEGLSQTALDAMKDVINETPQQSLVEHDCEVIEKLKRYLCELAENATENGYKDEANFMSETVEQVDIYISDNLRNSVKDGE